MRRRDRNVRERRDCPAVAALHRHRCDVPLCECGVHLNVVVVAADEDEPQLRYTKHRRDVWHRRRRRHRQRSTRKRVPIRICACNNNRSGVDLPLTILPLVLVALCKRGFFHLPLSVFARTLSLRLAGRVRDWLAELRVWASV